MNNLIQFEPLGQWLNFWVTVIECISHIDWLANMSVSWDQVTYNKKNWYRSADYNVYTKWLEKRNRKRAPFSLPFIAFIHERRTKVQMLCINGKWKSLLLVIRQKTYKIVFVSVFHVRWWNLIKFIVAMSTCCLSDVFLFIMVYIACKWNKKMSIIISTKLLKSKHFFIWNELLTILKTILNYK